MLTHVNYKTCIMNQRQYLLNQLRKQGLDIKYRAICGTSYSPVSICFTCIRRTDNCFYINRIDAIFAKGFKWRLTTKLLKAEDIIEHSDKQLFRAILISDDCLNQLLPPRKYCFGRNLKKKVMVWNFH